MPRHHSRIEDVEKLKMQLDLEKLLSYDRLKEIYVSNAIGLNPEKIVKEFKLYDIRTKTSHYDYQGLTDQEKVEFALRIYKINRNKIITKKYGLKKPAQQNACLTVSEAKAYLRIEKDQTLYDMIKEKELGFTINNNSKKASFVKVKKLKEYLGKYAGHKLYTSSEVAEIMKKDLKIFRDPAGWIKDHARRKQIGFKLRPDQRNSKYLFCMNDIKRLKDYL